MLHLFADYISTPALPVLVYSSAGIPGNVQPYERFIAPPSFGSLGLDAIPIRSWRSFPIGDHMVYRSEPFILQNAGPTPITIRSIWAMASFQGRERQLLLVKVPESPLTLSPLHGRLVRSIQVIQFPGEDQQLCCSFGTWKPPLVRRPRRGKRRNRH